MDTADDFTFAEDYPLVPLDDDCRLLGSLLDDCIRQESGEEVMSCIERVRDLAKSYTLLESHCAGGEKKLRVEEKKNEAEEEDSSSLDVHPHPVAADSISDLSEMIRQRLVEELRNLDVEDAITVSRSCGTYLVLSAIAETHHRVRRAQEERNHRYCDEVFQNLIASGVQPTELYHKLINQRVEVVLTAHPTQVKRRTLQHKHTRIEALLYIKDMDLSHEERDQAIEELMREITTLWHTSELRSRKPTPIDEARGGLHIVEQSLWTALPKYLRRLNAALKKHTGMPLPHDCSPIVFSSWMGGDRDGNPNVTAKVTKEVVCLARWIAADLYLREIDMLRFELSLSKCNDELRRLATEIESEKMESEKFFEHNRVNHGRNASKEDLDHLAKSSAGAESFLPEGMITSTLPMGDASLSSSSNLGGFSMLNIGGDVNEMSMINSACEPSVGPLSPEGTIHLASASKAREEEGGGGGGKREASPRSGMKAANSSISLSSSSSSLKGAGDPPKSSSKKTSGSDKTGNQKKKAVDSLLNPTHHLNEGQTPYRVVLGEVRRRLINTKSLCEDHLSGGDPSNFADEDIFSNEESLIQFLTLCYNSLCETGATIVAEGRLLDLIRRCHAFGMTLMKLDVRQESGRHCEVLDAVTQFLGIGRYSDWEEERKCSWLLQEMKSKRPLIPRSFPMSANVAESLDTMRMIFSPLLKGALGAYIISMASKQSDVLAVILLQKEAGMMVASMKEEMYSDSNMLRVVPLFETLSDLNNGPEIMDKLLSIEWYRALIRDVFDNKLEIMLGYSDSGKDAGRFAAAWALYQSQERLVDVCASHDVELTLFHGRGGSIGRGGGPMYLAIQSQPPGSMGKGKLRVTEQGEMVQAKFGTGNIALRQMEIVTTAVLKAGLSNPVVEQPKYREIMDKLSKISCEKYREKVFETPAFLSYFKKATPEAEIGHLNIGSRPSRRKKGSSSVKDLRAIPWIFAWTQNRLVLPAWLGIGQALQTLIEEGKLADLREMYERWPFFQSTVDLIEMVLAKADGKIAKYYEDILIPENPVEKKLGQELRGLLDLTACNILKVSGHEKLCENNKILRHLIEKRKSFIEPINILQVEILRRLRMSAEGSPSNLRLREALLITINGVAAGMRNTG